MDYQAFQAHLLDKHPSLSPQLQRIARYVIDQPEQAALETVAQMAQKLQVQPSSLIRFAKALGFSGYQEIQRILRGQLAYQPSAARYEKRVVDLDPSAPIAQFRDLAYSSLERLPSQEDIDALAQIMLAAQGLHILGFGRSFGIAHQLAYLLAGFGARVQQVQIPGQSESLALSMLGPRDLVVAISFPDYHTSSLHLANLALQQGAKLVAITDSRLSPFSQLAQHSLLVDAGTTAGFRSSAGALVTAQALAASYGKGKQNSER